METFTRLYPDRAEGLSPVDVAAELPGAAPDDRPFVCLNMISTADGRATVKGRAGHIANRADYELFHATRARMDAIMVGAETIRVESYGRAINSAEARERREREGMPADIATVVVTRRVSLPADVGLLKAAENTVIVLTPSEDGELPAEAKATVEYLREPDLPEGLRRLRREHGIRVARLRGRPEPQRDAAAGGPGRRAAPRLRAEAGRRPRPADDPRRRRARPADRPRAHHAARVRRLPVLPLPRALAGLMDTARKRRLSKIASVKLLNPVMRRALEAGLVPRGWALLETTGRRSGRPRRVPVGSGLRGPHFWIVAEHGRHADYVRNIEHDPRVRVKVGRRWRSGTAHVLPEDDPRARLRMLKRPLNDIGLRAMASEMVVVRVDLDPPTT